MKIKIGNSLNYLDIEDISNLSKKEKQLIVDIIKERNIKCDGCGKLLTVDNWIVTFHRPKSAYDEETGKGKELWTLYFLCHDTRKDCGKKWLDRRPK